MTETTGRQDAERRTTITADQLAQQRRGAAVLSRMLKRAAAEGLPPIAWTVASAGPGLAGRCEACRMTQRRADFSAWRAALGTWAGRSADAQREYASGGTVRLVDQWDRIDHVTVTLAAAIWAEE